MSDRTEPTTNASPANGARPHILPGAHRDWAFSFALFVVALLPRLFVALAWSREPVWDGHYYHYGAERIAQGFGYSGVVTIAGETAIRPWSHYPVGYSAVLAVVYRIFGSANGVAPLVGALIGSLLVLALHRLARYYLGRDRARVAATIAALHPGLIAYAALVMSEPLGALLIVVALWAAMARGRSALGWILAGMLLGMATLVRPASILAAPLLMLTDRGFGFHGLRRALLASLIAGICVLPWTVRNCRVMDGCALVSTNGGWNLAIGALTTSGRYRALAPEEGCAAVRGQVEQDRCWAGVARDVIRRDPWGWLSLAPLKLGQTFDHESYPFEYLGEANPDQWPEERRAAGRKLLTWFHRLLLLAAALGAVAFPPKTPALAGRVQAALALLLLALFFYASFDTVMHPYWLLPIVTPLLVLLHLPGRIVQGPVGRYSLGFVLVTALTHVVFFGEDRYHLVLIPFWCLLAAGALRLESDRPAVLGG